MPLTVTRAVGDTLLIGDSIKVEFVQVQGKRVRVSISAPDDVKIMRSELVLCTDRDIGFETVLSVSFEGDGRDFSALDSAAKWCQQAGYSVGFLQANCPIGVKRGRFAISKWRGLSESERLTLDGALVGDFRNGPVHLRMKPSDSAK